MIKLIKDSLKKIKLFYILKILSSFLIQIASLYLVYVLSPTDYGYLALIISVSQLMYILTSGWTNGALINLGSKKFAETGSYNSIVIYRLIIVLFSFVIVSFLFFILEKQISQILIDNNNYYLVFILFLGYVLYDFASNLLYPGNKDLAQSFLDFLTTSSLLILTVFFVISISSYIFIFTSIYFLFALVVISLFLYFYADLKFKFSKVEFTFLFKYSMWQFLSVISIYVINIGVNYLFIYYEISVDQIGLYNFSYKMFSGFAAFFALFGVLIPKWIHSYDKLKLHKLLIKRILFIILGLTSIYLILAFALKPFIILIGKDDYLNSINYFFYLFPAFILMSYVNLINTVIMNTAFYKHAQFAIVLQALSLIIFSFFTIKYFGVYGAIISTTISFLVGSLYLFSLYKNKVKQSFLFNTKW